jgi:hypothetical protein
LKAYYDKVEENARLTRYQKSQANMPFIERYREIFKPVEPVLIKRLGGGGGMQDKLLGLDAAISYADQQLAFAKENKPY